MKTEISKCDLTNIIHSAKISRIAEQHIEKAKSQEARAKAEVSKSTKERNSDVKDGLKFIAKHIGDQGAKPLTCVERDRGTADGGTKGEIASNPKEVDAIVKRAWSAIHQGMQGCIDTAVDTYLNNYTRYIYRAAPFQVKDITAERVQMAFKKIGESAGGMDGWSPLELSYFSTKVCGKVAILFNQVEKGAPWPKAVEHARIVFLEKDGAEVGKVMSYRPLTITSPLYRAWASLRLEDMEDWIKMWALPEIFAGVPGKGATDAWYEVLTKIEGLRLDKIPFCGGVADIAKQIDQLRRSLVYKLAETAGMPPGVLRAYKDFVEKLEIYNSVAGGLGTPYQRRCGIPQGCPFSMMLVALTMRPWVFLMKTVPDTKAFILADDVLVISTGINMIRNTADAIDKTHEFLHIMGSKVAPDKSYNFASTKEAKVWLQDTWWSGINSKIEVVDDFRYLGAHLTTKADCVSNTLEKRWTKAQTQLKKLRYAQVGHEMKIRVIESKVFAAAMYGIEAAEVSVNKVAKLTTQVIDAFRSRNNDHNVDKFFTTISNSEQELDPNIQIFTRRALQMRRTCGKKKGVAENLKKQIWKYAELNKDSNGWPKWFQPNEGKDYSRPTKYPCEQPHPSTKDHDSNWRAQIKPMGPVGLLIESIIWNGLVIDGEMRIWQSEEEPIDLIAYPFQRLKAALNATAARARTRAEWLRPNTKGIRVREIDRAATQVDPKMSDEDKGMVRTTMMGGKMAKQEIAKFNNDYDDLCDYCLEAPSTSDHIKWGCKFFEHTRSEVDKDLAAIPRHYLPACVRCAIAPAMKIEGNRTFWGGEPGEDLTAKAKQLFGVDNLLLEPGLNGDETRKRKAAMKIIHDPIRGRKNARQTMLLHKGAHGTGINPDFPNKQSIIGNMVGHPEDFYADVYGDGSYTTPTKWWAALGGQGGVVRDWNLQGEEIENRKEENFAEAALGQEGSSTRQELTAWIRVLTKPIRSLYATDSASMLGKACFLLAKAAEIESKDEKQERVMNRENPYRRAWSLQTDGDLWEIAWQAILQRGSQSQTNRKVKGHATQEDVENGTSTVKDRAGNDRSDTNADEGVEKIGGEGLVRLGAWIAERHDRYIALMRRIQRFIAAVTKEEKEERERRDIATKATIGYDPKKWIKTSPVIKDEKLETISYADINIPPPVTGRHKFDYCQGQYNSIHAFISGRRWADARETEGISGATWLEIFALYDTCGARGEEASHIKDKKANERAEQRSSKRKMETRINERKRTKGVAVIMPTLKEELGRFKAICRHIMRHETDGDHAQWFHMEQRYGLRRLAKLGITGNQPAISAFVQMSQQEREDVARSIYMQKIGHNVKTMKQYDEHKKKIKEAEEAKKKEMDCVRKGSKKEDPDKQEKQRWRKSRRKSRTSTSLSKSTVLQRARLSDGKGTSRR